MICPPNVATNWYNAASAMLDASGHDRLGNRQARDVKAAGCKRINSGQQTCKRTARLEEQQDAHALGR
jgi:hypothetical protein